MTALCTEKEPANVHELYCSNALSRCTKSQDVQVILHS